MAVLKREKKDADHIIQEMREVGDEIKKLDDELRTVEESLQHILFSIPNIPMTLYQLVKQKTTTWK
ncbi:hypothetical protein BsIDN1_00380 [Bacillus safensis]|uniref:Serine-tRNA synthetase type1 N-terminal domain-containing protein n=1 Tax=Bacillus safensis TaxID=561879 RepID=A0A5S9LYC5_BACIA|nr:hypothetical protein BsIDN1_00380 [Bacillus safensis]